MNTPSASPAKHSRLILLLILAVVIGPFLFAWVLVKRADLHEFKTTNHGDLIPSPPNVSQHNFYDFNDKTTTSGKKLLGKWWLVYVGPQKCYQECQEVLYNLKQLHVALGKDSSRLDRLFIPHPNCPNDLCEVFLSEYYPDLTRAKFESKDFKALFTYPTLALENETLGDIYIIDPLGNVMMHYSPEMEPKSILSDLKRLLRTSKIG